MENDLKKPSTATTLSYSAYFFWYQFMTGIFDVFMIYFYNVKLNLDIIWVTAAIWVYTIWDAFNEPIVGFLTDRITKYTRKYGKRAPWIFIGGILAITGFILVYVPPVTDGSVYPILLFLWMCFSYCLYDTGLTMADINIIALFPDKFRSQPARRKVQTWQTPISLMALPLSALLPSMLLFNDDVISYRIFALIAGAILIVTFILGIYGFKEPPEVIDRYYYAKPEHRENFWTALKNSFKQRAWVAMLIIGYGYGLVIGALQSSVPYVMDFLLKSVLNPVNDFLFFIIMGGMVMGGALFSPLWSLLFKKINNNKISYLVAGFTLAATTILNGFIVNELTAIIYVTIFGISMGAFWILNSLILADVYDQRTVMYKTDQRGAAVGVMGFMGRFGRLIMITMIALIQVTTGFNPGLPVQTSLAKIGLRLQMGIIPGIFYAVLLIIWIFIYPLNKKKVEDVRNQLKELKL